MKVFACSVKGLRYRQYAASSSTPDDLPGADLEASLPIAFPLVEERNQKDSLQHLMQKLLIGIQ